MSDSVNGGAAAAAAEAAARGEEIVNKPDWTGIEEVRVNTFLLTKLCAGVCSMLVPPSLARPFTTFPSRPVALRPPWGWLRTTKYWATLTHGLAVSSYRVCSCARSSR